MTRERKRKQFEDAVIAARPRMLAKANKIVENKDAEDVVGEAYLIIFASRDWEAVKNPVGWAVGVVEGVGLNWRRRMVNRECTVLDGKHVFSWTEDGAIFETCADALVSPDQGVLDKIIADEEHAENLAKVMKAAENAGLTTSEESVLWARLQDKDYSEIATQLGLGAGKRGDLSQQRAVQIRRVVTAQDLYKAGEGQEKTNERN
jgi:DNA-directed RNA polymerase specialized sigma24 family protein